MQQEQIENWWRDLWINQVIFIFAYVKGQCGTPAINPQSHSQIKANEEADYANRWHKHDTDESEYLYFPIFHKYGSNGDSGFPKGFFQWQFLSIIRKHPGAKRY